jgi:hypothetical protein
MASTGFALDEHQECAEHRYFFRPEARSKYPDLLGYRVVEKWNVPSAHLYELHTAGMSHMKLEQL